MAFVDPPFTGTGTEADPLGLNLPARTMMLSVTSIDTEDVAQYIYGRGQGSTSGVTATVNRFLCPFPINAVRLEVLGEPGAAGNAGVWNTSVLEADGTTLYAGTSLELDLRNASLSNTFAGVTKFTFAQSLPAGTSFYVASSIDHVSPGVSGGFSKVNIFAEY